jgi:heparanase
LLWGRLMGTKVLRVETNSANMRVYAHCLKGKRGGVALVAVNLAPTASEVRFVGTGQLYALAGVENGAAATLNGKLVALGKNDAIPPMKSVMATDTAPVAAAGVSFVALPNAGSPACR